MVLIFLISLVMFILRVSYLRCPDVNSEHLFSLLCYGKVSLNCFEDEEEIKALLTLIVGRSRAEKIAEVLRNRKIYSFSEFEEIKGIGPKSVEKIKKIFTLKRCSQNSYKFEGD